MAKRAARVAALGNRYWTLSAASKASPIPTDEITRLRERVAHLERVVAAADDMRRQFEMFAGIKGTPLVRLHSALAYDAIRKGEK